MKLTSDALIKYNKKTTANLIKEAQRQINDWVLFRDAGRGCISCGSRSTKRNAGHYFEKHLFPSVRFNVENIHSQCVKCNHWQAAGMQVGGYYYQNLITKIGVNRYLELEASAKQKKRLHRIEVIEILEKYKKLNKEIKQKYGFKKSSVYASLIFRHKQTGQTIEKIKNTPLQW